MKPLVFKMKDIFIYKIDKYKRQTDQREIEEFEDIWGQLTKDASERDYFFEFMTSFTAEFVQYKLNELLLTL
jgi:hypothetical protein